MYPHSFLWHLLWLAPRVLQIFIAAIIIRRRLVREFPVFFVYTLFQVISEGTLFVLDHNAAVSGYQYWYVYWIGLTVSSALRFGIICGICPNGCRTNPRFGRAYRVVFRPALASLRFL